MNGVPQQETEELWERVAYLEKVNRWYTFALDLATSMVHLHGKVSYTRNPAIILEEGQKFLRRLLINFNLSAFFTVDERNSDFILSNCHPPEQKAWAESLQERLIGNGEFAWALNQNRTVVSRLREPDQGPILLHVLATKSRVRGMFIGVLEPSDEEIFDTLSNLLSIIFHNTAYALESAELYQLLDDLNHNLERRVREGLFHIQDQNRLLAEQVAALDRSHREQEAANRHLLEEVARHRATSQRLIQSEHRLRSVTQFTTDAIVAFDEEGVITLFNRGAERIFHHTAEQMVGSAIATLIPAESRESYQRAMALLQQDGPNRLEGQLLEFQGVRADGKRFPLELTLSSWTDQQQRQYVAVIRDITRRKQEEERRQREYQSQEVIGRILRGLVEPLPQQDQLSRALEQILAVPWLGFTPRGAIFLTEPDGATLTLAAGHNLPEAVRDGCRTIRLGHCLCGLAAQQRRLLFIPHPDDPRHVPPSREVEDHGHYCVPILSGAELLGVLCLYLTPGHQPDPLEAPFLATVADTLAEVIQRNRMDQALQRAKERADAANRAKSDFLAAMSHDIRAPLNAVIGMGELLADSPLSPDQEEWVDAARRAGEALLALINDVLDLSKIEAGELALEAVPFSLRELVGGCAKIFSFQAAEKGLALECRFAEALPDQVVGDPERLRQVLLNLIGNAVKFTEAGSVTVSMERGEGEFIRFAVSDTGIGISPERQDAIFQPFVQADGSIHRRHGGTGLGLTICRRLVTAMGGALGVTSAPGQGSRFLFSLPLAAAEPAAAADAPPTPEVPLPESAPLAVLLVDDSDDSRLLLRAFLKGSAGRLDEAENGVQALALIHDHHYDVVLMDMQMPVMDGFATTRAIRAREKEKDLPRLPIVALTAYAMKEEFKRTREAGCDFHVVKPINRKRLLAVIRQAAGR